MSAEKESDDFDTLAVYLPRAFAIELKAYSFAKPATEPGIPTFDNTTFPIFMHEVAHLVQDRATFRGVMDFLDMWDQIEATSIYARTADENVLLPIVDAKSGKSRLSGEYKWAVELAAFRQYRNPRHDWTRGCFWAFEEYSVERRSLDLSGRRIEHPIVTVHLVDNETDEQYDHVLGAWEIKEAYSVAVEILHGGEEKQPADWFEYLVVERILGRYFGEVTPEQTIALCHWALQDRAPADALFVLIKGLEEEYSTLPSPQDIYEFGRREALARGYEENCRDIIELLRKIEQSMQAQEPSMGNMFRWFRLHAERLLELHLVPDRRFPIDTFLCNCSSGLSSDERNTALGRFFAEVEVPLIVWPEGELYSISNTAGATEAVFLNRCVSDLFRRMWSKHEPEWQCPIYQGCNLPFRDDLDCRSRPWKKSAVQLTCPYGAAANILGLGNNKVPVFTPFDSEDSEL